jgi:hypothetical protein
MPNDVVKIRSIGNRAPLEEYLDAVLPCCLGQTGADAKSRKVYGEAPMGVWAKLGCESAALFPVGYLSARTETGCRSGSQRNTSNLCQWICKRARADLSQYEVVAPKVMEGFSTMESMMGRVRGADWGEVGPQLGDSG